MEEMKQTPVKKNRNRKTGLKEPARTDLTTPAEIPNPVDELRRRHIDPDGQREALYRSQMETSDSHRKYEELFNFAPVGYFILDKEGYVRESNVTGASLLGIEKSSLIGDTLYRFITPEYPGVFQSHLHAAARTQSKQSCRLKLSRLDGSKFDALIETIAAMDHNGQLDCYRSSLTDITDISRQEELANLSTFPMLIPNPIMEVDAAGAVYFINPAAEGLFPDLRRLGLKHPWFAQWESVLSIFDKDRTAEVRKEIQISEKWFGQSFYFMEDTLKIRIYGREITLRKKLQDALQKSEKDYRDLVESAGSIIIRWTPDGKITFFNKFALSFFGYDKDEIIGRSVNLLIPKTDSQGLDLSHLVDDILNHPDEYENHENENILKSGKHVWIQWTNKCILDEAGCVREVLAIGNNITRRKQMEIELQKKTLQLEVANKELDSFTYSVSHDLRAPLRAIDGFSRMILKRKGDQFDDDTKSKFDVIRNNTRAMDQLIDDLLAFSRMGKQEMAMSNLDMGDLFADAWAELKLANADRNIVLSIGSLPSIHGDRALIKQVIVNLLSNAVKFTKKLDDARIETGTIASENEVVFYVKDNGVGFDKEYQHKLFGVFQRLHSAEEFEGTGVGLAIVKRIIHRHGGRVWAEGELNRGACFYFTLPK